MISNDLIKEKTDLRYLEWSRARESSGTAGSFLKAYETRNDKKIYYKLSSYDPVSGITGKECFNELIVSRLLNLLDVHHLDYQLIHADVSINDRIYETYLCASRDFKDKGDRKITLEDIYELRKISGESILGFCDRMGWLDECFRMMVVDFLVINRDRHGANIEIINRKGLKKLEPTPLFDHGMSLIYNCYDEKQVRNFDTMADLPVQSFVGSRSLFQNLELIPKGRMPVFRRLDERDKEYLFRDLEDLLPDYYREKIWQIIWERWNYYENLRNRQ